VHTRFWWGNLRGGDHLEGVGRRWKDNIKLDLQEVERRDMNWLDLAQDWDRWRAFISAAVNLLDY